MTQLPTVSGKNLLRQKMVFPRDFEARFNLVFIAFQQWHQDQVDSWVPLVDKMASEIPGFEYYEFPTIYRMNRLSQTLLNEGMRAGIPNEATRRRTITLYLDKTSFRDALGIPDESQTVVMLFDQEGQVLWQDKGAYSPEKGVALQTAVSELTAI